MRFQYLTFFIISLLVFIGLSEKTGYSQIAGLMIQRIEVKYGSVSGFIHTEADATNESTLPVDGADVIVISSSGDTLCTKSENGYFKLENIKQGQAQLLVNKQGFMPFREQVNVSNGDLMVIVELLTRALEEIDAASISARSSVYTMRGDTLVYNPSAVTSLPGDYAIDIVKQLPGVNISDMVITVGGKTVMKTYVNGVLIFGRNPLDALNYLAAEAVETIEVYDEVYDADGNLPSREERVMDIKTKDPVEYVVDLQALLAGGLSEPFDDRPQRYATGVSGRLFSDELTVKASAVSSNVGTGNADTNLGDIQYSRLHGRQVDNSAMIGVEKMWGRDIMKRTELIFNYSFAQGRVRDNETIMTEYFGPDKVSLRNSVDSVSNYTSFQSHTASIALNATLKKTVRFSWNNSIGIDKRTAETGREAISSISGGSYFRESLGEFNKGKSYYVNETLAVNGLAKPFSVSANLRIGGAPSSGWIIDTLQTSFNRRYLTRSGDSAQRNFFADARYSIRVGEQSFLTPSYSFTRSLAVKNQMGFDLLDGKDPKVNSFNTFDYTFKYHKHSGGLRFQRGFSSVNIDVEYSEVDDHERYPYDITKAKNRYLKLLPGFRLELFDKRLNVELKSSSVIPSLEQVRPMVDDTRSIMISVGNPDLSASTVYDFSASLLPKKSKMITSGLSFRVSAVSKPIVRKNTLYRTKTVLDDYDHYVMPAGSTLISYENADWSVVTSVNDVLNGAGYMFKDKLPVTYSFQAGVGYSISPQYLGENLSLTKEFSIPVSATMISTVTNWLRTSLGIRSSYFSDKNSISMFDRKVVSLNADASVKIMPTEHTLIECAYSRDSHWFIGEKSQWGYNYLKISAGINLVDGRLSVMFDGVDLLNQGIDYTSTLSPYAFIQTYKPVFGRYYMFTLKYRFNSSNQR